MRQVFLEKNRDKKSVNENSYVGVNLTSRSRLSPYNSTNDVLNLNGLYTKERDECTKYRVILAVNSICSNVLFNTRTEVVRYEGSDNCVLINGSKFGDEGYAVNNTIFDWKQAIRDTEYTHPDLFGGKAEPYVYHCGFDIFNNHMLRKNDFVYINKSRQGNATFNTLKDVVRDNNGDNVSEVVSLFDVSKTKSNVHVYQYDTLLDMYDAFSLNLKEVDGWYGFYNTTNVNIPNATVKDEKGNNVDICINKVMNNNKACELIDLYPDRSLFNFIPKVNKYRHRVEKNWDYCLSYPYEKDVKKFNEIMGLDENLAIDNGGGSIKIISHKITYSASGAELVTLKPMIKSTIVPNDYITLYYIPEGETTPIKFNDKILIIGVGDYEGYDKDKCFSFRFDDIANKFILDENKTIKTKDDKTVTFYYKKNVVGYDCEYYLRKFKKIKNINGEELISVVNKLAYGENIYGDRIAQIVYTDTIDIDGLVDETERRITDMYFTVIKRNKGHEKWYGENIVNTEDIEFSHCFGEVTSGIEMGEDVDDYNVRKLHNIDVTDSAFAEGTGNNIVFGTLKMVEPIQRDITIEDDFWDDGLYGDIVEFDIYNYQRNVLEIVQHRFNTAQREYYKDDKYAEVLCDKLMYDDYDIGVTKDENGQVVQEFTVRETNLSTINGKTFYGNICPEGYFYNPFTKIKLCEENENAFRVSGLNIKYDTGRVNKFNVRIKDESGESITVDGIRLHTYVNYNFIKGDMVCFYSIETKEQQWLSVYEADGTDVKFISDSVNLDKIIAMLTRGTVYVIKTDDGVPKYAKYLPNAHSFVWKSILTPSTLPVDSDIYYRPFANGCFYIEKNCNLFLKRQDPTNKYGLLDCSVADANNLLCQYRVWGWDAIDFKNIVFNNGLINDICM